MKIRRAEMDDAAVVLDLYRRCMAELAGMGGYPIEEDDAAWESSFSSLCEMIHNPNERAVFVAEKDGKVVGYEVAFIYDLEPPYKPMRLMKSVSTYILPEHRGSKLARDLVQTAIDWAKELGATNLEAFALSGNRSKILMERHGFNIGGYELRRQA